MYIAAVQGQTPGDKILISTETPCHFGHLLQVKKNVFEVWFFHDFIHVYTPGAVTTPWEIFFYINSNILSLKWVICYKFKKNLFEVWFYTIFFMILYMYIAMGQGQTAPRGQSFNINRNVLSLHSFVASFKKNIFEVWFYTSFFMI